jgi:hypothetical protein
VPLWGGEWSGSSDDCCLGPLTPFAWPWPDQLGGGHDKYTRTIGDVILPEGMNLNQELVKQGRW